MRWLISFYTGHTPMPTSYNAFFVILGLSIAILGAYSSLTFMESTVASALSLKRSSTGGSLLFSVLAVAVTVGVNTVFLMHFVSASALSHGSLPVKYELGVTLSSMFFIFLGVLLGFLLVATSPRDGLLADERARTSSQFLQLYYTRPADSAPWAEHIRHLIAQVRTGFTWRVVVGGALVGTGILAMHYLGMVSMRAKMLIVFDPIWIGLTPVVGTVGGTAALLILMTAHGSKRRVPAALLLGGATTAAHWYGMGSSSFYPLPPGWTDDSAPGDVLIDAKVACVVVALLSSIIRFALSGAIAVSAE